MKYQRHNNTSSLFLLELILAVLFFSVASALCIQIFTKAHLMSQDARDLNFAVNEVSSMAEQISAGTLHSDTAQLHPVIQHLIRPHRCPTIHCRMPPPTMTAAMHPVKKQMPFMS